MANDFLQGLQVGAGIGSNILQNNARLQQLKSERAHQMAQERATAQIMAMKMAENDRLIQYRADMAKGMSAFQMATSPVVPVMGPSGPIGEVPNPKPLTQTQAALQFILPVIGKFDPEKVPEAMQDIAMTEYRQRAANQVGQAPVRTPEQVAADKALEAQRNSAADLNKARIDEIKNKSGPSFAPTDIQKKIEYFEKRGIKLTSDQLQKVANVTLGIDPRAGTEEARGNAVMRVFTQLREVRPKSESDGLVLRDARRLVDAIYEEDALGNGPVQPAQPKPSGKKIRVRSPDGHLGTIPEEDLEKAIKNGYKIFDANAKE